MPTANARLLLIGPCSVAVVVTVVVVLVVVPGLMLVARECVMIVMVMRSMARIVALVGRGRAV